MNLRRMPLFFAALLAASFGSTDRSAIASSPSFSIVASNAALAGDGTGSIAWSVTSVDGYSGNVRLVCNPTNIPSGARLPFCGGSVAPQIYAVPANGAVTGNLALFATPVPCSNPCPVKLNRTRSGAASGIVLTGVLLIGLGFSRRKPRWLAVLLFAAGTLVGIPLITDCGANGNGMTLTAGVWPYTVTAADINTNESASITITVTVPAGIRGSGLE
jgi:hypothetical protein